MTNEEFMTFATHADNLGEEALQSLNWEEIEQLPAEAKIIQEALFLWSQFIVGNVSEPADDIRAMDAEDRRRVLRTWIDITNDEMALRSISIFILETLA
ncbi:hypothetical protein [Limnobacter sp. MED105]|uniref:hypothetical protein n=1 Tax=Limnobacter sp. MED105 TaxID=391597 RepID=UPI000156C34C|nr:hypothetical protein [Limnobacter sp. MED105]EDM82803.1 hypothetical protein LMED105_16118 [Limnobacter sp. MED105]